MEEYIKKSALRACISEWLDELLAEKPKTRAGKRAVERAFYAYHKVAGYLAQAAPADVVSAYDEAVGPVDRKMLMEMLSREYRQIQKYWRDTSYGREKYLEGYRAAMETARNYTESMGAARDERNGAITSASTDTLARARPARAAQNEKQRDGGRRK